MEFIQDNINLKIVPSELKGITNGIIIKHEDRHFCVELVNPNLEYLKLNETVEIIIPYNSCIITFKSSILSINNNIFEFSLPEKYRQVQRREYTRVDITLPIEIKELNNGKNEESQTKNISGGGIQLISSNIYNSGSKLEVKFKISDNKSIASILQVLRVSKESENNKFYIAGKFIKISNKDRTEIIQLCFKKTLERNYKKLS